MARPARKVIITCAVTGVAASNAKRATEVRRILEELSYEIASPLDARRLLGLKGTDGVAF